MIDTLVDWIETNPNKNATLANITIKVFSDTNDDDVTPLLGPGSVGIVPLDPPGPIALYLWHTNPEYRAGNFITRKVILREHIIKLNERFDQELKGRTWNRKKVIEQLQQQESSAVSPPQKSPELNKAICYVMGFQYAEVDEIHKKVYVYPSDLRTWSNELPIYLASYGSRSVYTKNKEQNVKEYFKSWFFELMNNDYTIEWPEQDGTVKELKEKMDSYFLTMSKEKPKKEDYSLLIGKAETIRHINNEF